MTVAADLERGEFLLGKAMAVFLPSVAVAYAVNSVFLVCVALFAPPSGGPALVQGPDMLDQLWCSARTRSSPANQPDPSRALALHAGLSCGLLASAVARPKRRDKRIALSTARRSAQPSRSPAS